jgi:amino acid permease
LEFDLEVEIMEVGFLGLLQIVFIVLKVLDKITWSWWMVFIPLWIELSIILIVLIIHAIIKKSERLRRGK